SDAVVKPERFAIAVRPVSALHAAGQLDDAACRLVQQRALCVARDFEPSLRFRVDEEHRMDGRFSRSAELPFGGIALLGISQHTRSIRTRDTLLELERKGVEN